MGCFVLSTIDEAVIKFLCKEKVVGVVDAVLQLAAYESEDNSLDHVTWMS